VSVCERERLRWMQADIFSLIRAFFRIRLTLDGNQEEDVCVCVCVCCAV